MQIAIDAYVQLYDEYLRHMMSIYTMHVRICSADVLASLWP